MTTTINRRQFLKYSMSGIAVIAVGSRLPWVFNRAFAVAQVQTLDFHITDAIKEMHTHNAINDARCYFWIYKSTVPDLLPECPGPTIMAAVGDEIGVSVTNDLDEPHAFYIPGIVDSGPIAPGATWTGSFTATTAGAHLYYDNLNEPVNRVMGLHGALIVMPAEAAPGHRFTPYDSPTTAVQRLFDDFGSAVYPGLAWEEGDEATSTPPFRHYLWLLHEASPKLFAQVGDYTPGADYPADQFMDAFLRDPFQPHAFHADNPGGNRIPQYFTINGQHGHLAHNNCYITPMGRVGEPAVIYILNAGLWTHSMHLHANHMYITSVNGVVQANPIWVDVFTVHPMDRVDYTVPFMRPPDVPNARGIGRPDTPLTSLHGTPVWPPMEEIEVRIPDIGELVLKRPDGSPVDCEQRLSPLCYPMHDHSEPTQTSQGGNYNTGLISGIYFTGDRNMPPIPHPEVPTFPLDFPMEADWRQMYDTGIDRGCYLTGTHPAGDYAHHGEP